MRPREPRAAHAFLLLAEAAGTMRHIRDHVQVRWYPPGSYVVEQGEVAAGLFLILSGEAEVREEGSGGRREQPGRLGVGEFFGHRHRSADVVAAASLTCLVLSPAPPAKFAGRGRGARLAGAVPGARADASPAAGNLRAAQGAVCCDVSGQVMRKVEALSAYRSQFPLEPGMSRSLTRAGLTGAPGCAVLCAVDDRFLMPRRSDSRRAATGARGHCPSCCCR